LLSSLAILFDHAQAQGVWEAYPAATGLWLVAGFWANGIVSVIGDSDGQPQPEPASTPAPLETAQRSIGWLLRKYVHGTSTGHLEWGM
jgi:hypothetical protein